jgi:hypothetical protein
MDGDESSLVVNYGARLIEVSDHMFREIIE